ncbi:MAG: DUF2807 domain-containing protein [Oscillospiraceae bacterium]|nr:DUF2807 domain-containing protein [Oscillospiraceae bacterium]
MKKFLLLPLTLAILLSILLSGCVGINFQSNGGLDTDNPLSSEYTTQTYDIGTYDTVMLSGIFVVAYTAADECAVSVDAQESLMQYVSITVEDGVLTADLNRDPIGDPPVLHLSAPTLKGLSIAGTVDMTTCDEIIAEHFQLNVSGLGALDLPLAVDSLRVSVDGASSIRLSGTAASADIVINGTGAVEAFELDTENTAVNIAGIGTCDISCSETLDIVIAGMGELRYRGDPEIHKDVSALATISNDDD